MTDTTPETVAAATPPTPETVAEMLTSGDGTYDDGNRWQLGLSAQGNVVHIRITPYSDVDEDDLDDEPVRLPDVHFRAVVVADDGTCYINGDDGYKWLTCSTCEEPLLEVAADTRYAEMAQAIAAHACTAGGAA